jgi:nitroreductase
MYSKFYREFQENDFDLDTDKNIRLVIKTNLHCFGNMMTSALVGIDSCPIEGFHQEKQKFLREKFGVDTDKYGLSLWLLLVIEKQIQQTLSQEEIQKILLLGCNF